MSIDLKKIKPRLIRKSDKYSSNLYKYLKLYPNSRVYKSVDIDNRTAMKIVVGHKNNEAITGTTLDHILASNMYRHYWLYSEYGEYEDITEQFMNDYIRIGRCLWDKDHKGWMNGDEERFSYINDDERVCNWCGEIQHKEEYEVVKKRVRWLTESKEEE